MVASLANVFRLHRFFTGPRLQWTLFSYLEDVDFADLIALSATLSHLQEKCDRLSSFARKTGLYINLKKTQVIYVDGPKHPESPTVEGNWSALTISLNSEALLVVTKVPIKASWSTFIKVRGAFSQRRSIGKSEQDRAL